MRRCVFMGSLVGILLAGGVWYSSRAADQPNEDAVRAFMRGKLDASEKVLEGLVTEDYEMIRLGSDRMRVMGRRAEWNVLKTPEYIQFSGEFQRAAERMGKAAREKNLDAASLAYLQLTMSCINCHTHARGVKVAHDDRIPDLTIAQQLAAATGDAQ